MFCIPRRLPRQVLGDKASCTDHEDARDMTQPEPEEDSLTRRLFTISAYPIRYLVIPKSGCTFVKNLLWLLDHGEPFASQKNIHDMDEAFVRASALGLTAADIRNESHAFTVIRDPVDRFFSLYKDKIIGSGFRNFPPLSEVLQKRFGLDPLADTAADHARNCGILIGWLADNLENGTDMKPDQHWTPQHYRGRYIRDMNLHVLVTSEVAPQLMVLLGDMVPGLPARLAICERNTTPFGYPRDAVIPEDVRRKINQTYARDRNMFDKASGLWLSGGQRNARGIPRGTEVF